MPRKVNDDCEHERMLADFLPALKGTLVTSYYFNIVKYDGYDVTQSFS